MVNPNFGNLANSNAVTSNVKSPSLKALGLQLKKVVSGQSSNVNVASRSSPTVTNSTDVIVGRTIVKPKVKLLKSQVKSKSTTTLPVTKTIKRPGEKIFLYLI